MVNAILFMRRYLIRPQLNPAIGAEVRVEWRVGIATVRYFQILYVVAAVLR